MHRLPALASFLSGFKFDETLNLGDAVVAFGTLTLAGVTFWLAVQTRREVSLSTSSIDLARQGIEAQDMPFVVAVPNPDQIQEVDKTVNNFWMWWGMEEGAFFTLRLRLWNMGKGPAIARDIRLVSGDGDLLLPPNGEAVIAPGGLHDITVRLYAEPPGGDQLGVLRIYYSHTSGKEYMTQSHAAVGPGGVRSTNFERRPSDGEGRSVLG